MGLSLVTPPSVEPVSLVEAKQHLRVDIDDDDEFIITLIASARVACENYLGRALMTQTWRQTFSCWGRWLQLGYPPHESITSVQYVDTAGDTQTLASSEYQTDLSSDLPAIICPAYGKTWPSLRQDTLNPVTVTFVSGYGAAADVPGPIKQAMKLLIGHLFENREAVNIGEMASDIPLAYRFLLDPYRVLYA